MLLGFWLVAWFGVCFGVYLLFFLNLNYVVLQKYSKKDSVLDRDPGLPASVSFRLGRKWVSDAQIWSFLGESWTVSLQNELLGERTRAMCHMHVACQLPILCAANTSWDQSDVSLCEDLSLFWLSMSPVCCCRLWTFLWSLAFPSNWLSNLLPVLRQYMPFSQDRVEDTNKDPWLQRNKLH